MGEMRMTGPDHLVVDVVSTAGSYGTWGRWLGIEADAALLATRDGAIVGMYGTPDELARVVDQAELRPG